MRNIISQENKAVDQTCGKKGVIIIAVKKIGAVLRQLPLVYCKLFANHAQLYIGIAFGTIENRFTLWQFDAQCFLQDFFYRRYMDDG